jgi:3-hydroxybutyrate dehydrogenase
LVEKQITDQARVHDLDPTEVVNKVLLANSAVKRLIDLTCTGESRS